MMALPAVLFASALAFAVADENVYSCGGFIKTDADVKIDFKNIVVRLYTAEGNLKYETDCAPNNGYFMIPVYAKGSYKVRVHPPAGWHFRPSEVALTVDGVSDPCTLGEDINFVLAGFSVTGKVKNLGSDTGPSGFGVSLLDTVTRAEVSATVTAEGGSYAFANVLPGAYAVVLDGGSSCVRDKESRITVHAAPTNAQKDIFIQGYSLAGKVENHKGAGLAGASLLLMATSSLPVQCDLSKASQIPVPDKLKNMKPICHVQSGKDGSFLFPCIPPGKYQVVAHHSVDGATFEVSPGSAEAVVGSAPSRVGAAFRVLGFGVSGKVLLAQGGPGAAGAEVSLNGERKATVAKDGSFRLERLQEAKFKLEVTLPQYEFAAVETVLSPKFHTLQPIVPSKVSVSGRVALGRVPSGVLSPKRRKVTVSGGPGGPFSITTAEDGTFSQLLPAASYVFRAEVSAEEKAAGVELVPAERAVKLSSVPVRDVLFRQFQAAVKGTVSCQPACTGLELRLREASGAKAQVAAQSLKESKTQHTFHFPDLLPGSYVVEIAGGSGLCWDKTERAVAVTKSDAEGTNFAQTGFQVTATPSNPVSMKWELKADAKVNGIQSLKTGRNTFCIPKSGEYKMTLESCHRFNLGETFVYSTAKPGALTLTATHHQVKGSVLSSAAIPDLKLTLKNTKTGSAEVLATKKTASGFEFVFQGEVGGALSLSAASATFLFSPKALPVSVGGDCVAGLEFRGYAGKFVEGRVTPPVAGVVVSLEQDGQAFSATTDAQGRYKVGPLETLTGMSYEAEKDGYVITHQADGHFTAFKLSELTIKASGEDGKPLDGVLISLSGGQNNYRSNNLTGEEGSITFVGLSPGSYFIRPVLKEFKFEPATRMVEIAEGTTLTVALAGKRVAFSAFGLVEHLGGDPVVGAKVLAVGGEECGRREEEGTTGDDGRFRVRGLQPGCAFTLRLKAHPDIHDTIPPSFSLTVKDGDVDGHRFLAAPMWKTLEVSGRVVTEQADWLKSCRVSISADSDPDNVIATHQLGLASTFYFQGIPIDNKGYSVRLESNLPKSQFDVDNLGVESFVADSDLKFVNFQFTPKRKRVEADIGSSGWMAVLAMALIAGAVYKQTLVLSALSWMAAELKERAKGVRRAAAEASSDSSPDLNFPSDPSGSAKRRVKSRKT